MPRSWTGRLPGSQLQITGGAQGPGSHAAEHGDAGACQWVRTPRKVLPRRLPWPRQLTRHGDNGDTAAWTGWTGRLRPQLTSANNGPWAENAFSIFLKVTFKKKRRKCDRDHMCPENLKCILSVLNRRSLPTSGGIQNQT